MGFKLTDDNDVISIECSAYGLPLSDSLKIFKEMTRKKKKFVVFSDLRESPPLRISGWSEFSEFISENKKFFKNECQAWAVVVKNSQQKTTVTAVDWMISREFPMRIFFCMIDARLWLADKQSEELKI